MKDVFLLSLTSFGGPQAHIAHFQNILVKKRRYLSEADLIELNALCQAVPGPTSTQTLSAVGYRLGGASLAYLTLLIWLLPSMVIMTAAGLLVNSYESTGLSLKFTRFIQPMAVGLIAYAGFTIALKTVTTKRAIFLMIVAALATYFVKSPWVFPVVLLLAGCFTAFNYKAHPRQEKKKFEVRWANFLLWAGVFVFAAVLGGVTKYLPVKLFENFYRNGSLVFGGGQVLVPMLYTEFVQFTKPLHHPTTHDEFLSGYAFAQALPGPVFSFSSYLGVLSMRDYGFWGQMLGSLMSTAGLFLPGTFLIFFLIRIWESLKTFRPIRASLEGIHAANAGLVAAAAVLLFQPLEMNGLNIAFTVGTFGLCAFTKIPNWAIIVIGLACGIIL